MRSGGLILLLATLILIVLAFAQAAAIDITVMFDRGSR